jgi:hypothetical protein
MTLHRLDVNSDHVCTSRFYQNMEKSLFLLEFSVKNNNCAFIIDKKCITCYWKTSFIFNLARRI